MLSRIAALLLSGVAVLHAQAQTAAAPAELVGTWSSKSNSTFTGPGFYNPVDDKFTEPKHTGISYSFTADGFYEEAYYRAVANPQNPKCPKGIIQWQHGKYEKLSNGSLVLTPIKVDGRQLFSDPCTYKYSVYTRYNATELFDRYEYVVSDAYAKIPRLTLYKADGAPMMPMYLAMSQPQMLPTTTLNPLVTQTAAAKNSKRGDVPLTHEAIFKRTTGSSTANQWWWFGVLMTASGSLLYYFF